MEPINAFNFPDSFVSPDQRFTLKYSDLMEIRGGNGPLIGALRIEPTQIDFATRRFGGPPIWSDEARYVAIPEWARTRDIFGDDTFSWQALTVFDLSEMREATLTDECAVLQIDSFQAGVIRGVDSPLHRPRAISATITTLDWQPLGSRQTPLCRQTPRRHQILGCAMMPVTLGALVIFGLVYRLGNWIRGKDE